jgi:hypothetical protein
MTAAKGISAACAISWKTRQTACQTFLFSGVRHGQPHVVPFAGTRYALGSDAKGCFSERGIIQRSIPMPRGDKSKYTDKQKRQAEKIEEGYEERGVGEKESERRAWATVNKMTGGGKKPGGSGRGKKVNKAPAKKGGKLGGAASAARSKTARSQSAKKAARTRKRNASKSRG